MGLVDFHVHSYFSDGVFSPEDLVRRAKANGAAGFALTDHDTFGGVERAQKAVREEAPELFFTAGCELSTFHPDIGEVHILGYVPRGGFEGLYPLLERFHKLRMERARRIVECLNDRKLAVDFDGLVASAGKGGHRHFPLGRMHIARELVRLGYYREPREAFDRYLKVGRACYVPRKLEDSLKAVAAIRENGGMAAIAHPLFLERTRNWKVLEGFLAAGLGGIEYRHPKVSQSLSARIEEELSATFYLLGGSDFHGDATDNPIGTYGIPREKAEEVFDNFLKK